MVYKIMLYRTKCISKIEKSDMDGIFLLSSIGQEFVHHKRVLNTPIYTFDKCFLSIWVKKTITKHVFR